MNLAWGKILPTFFDNMYWEKKSRDTVDGYLLDHLKSDRRWGEVQDELREKHPEIPSVEFRESLWRLIEQGKIVLTKDLTVRPRSVK